MLREFHPKEDELTDAANVARGQELQRLLHAYANTEDYWLGEVCEDWRTELDYRFNYRLMRFKSSCAGQCQGCNCH